MGWSRATVVEVAKRTGYPVVESWSGHNKGQMGTVFGPMLHHTGSANSTGADYPTLRVVRDGRAGLANSLSMYGLGKSGTIYCISEKISWHAGVGNWRGVTDGNGHFAGIEAESSGNGADWTPQQLDSYKRLVASILVATGRGVEWMCTHKEYALPAGRKPDPAGIDMALFRRNVQTYLNNPATINKNGGAAPDMTPEESNWLRQVFLGLYVGGPSAPGGVSFSDFLEHLNAKVDNLSNTVNQLSQRPSYTREELRKLLAEAVVDVNVNVNQQTQG